MPTFIVTVTFTTDPASDEHLRSEQAIRDEVRSWFASLRATVHTVTVRHSASPLTRADIDQIVEGIEHFIIGMDDDEELRAIWQPYIDKLNGLVEEGDAQ